VIQRLNLDANSRRERGMGGFYGDLPQGYIAKRYFGAMYVEAVFAIF
jgi:hypothetical protein